MTEAQPKIKKSTWVKVMEYRHIRNKQLEKAKKEYFEVRP